jgi:cell division protein FtsW
MILAIIGEELGLFGILGLISLYGMIGYAGLRAAKLAVDRYAKLLAAGITSLILCQATLNFFAVLGMMPLTGVPLPFISYGASNLVVLMGAMGLLLNVAATGGRAQRAGKPERQSERPELRAIDGGGDANDRDRRRRHGGTRRAGARGR